MSDQIEAAPEWPGLRQPDIAPGQDVVQRVPEVVTGHALGDPRVVESTAVPQPTLLVEHEDMEGALGAIRSGDLLALVDDVGEL